jgi:hypothetical protein
MPKTKLKERSPKLPQKTIDAIVKRVQGGARVDDVAAEEFANSDGDPVQINRSTIYLWCSQRRKAGVDKLRRDGISLAAVKAVPAAARAARIKELETENDRLWEKLREYIRRFGDL